MMADVPEPGSQMSVIVRGHEVIVRTAPDGTRQVTCPELPQVDMRDETLPRALARTEDAIDTFWAGRVHQTYDNSMMVQVATDWLRDRGYLPKAQAR